MSAISCLLPSIVMRVSDCLDWPVDEPDDEHATARAEREGTHGPRLENASSVCVDVRTLPAISAGRKEFAHERKAAKYRSS